MIRKVLHILTVFILLSGLVMAQGYQVRHVNGQLAASAAPPAPTPLENVTDSLSNYPAGQAAVEQIGFLYPTLADKPPGLNNGRQIVITFPEGFGLSEISTAIVHETDPSIDAPPLESVVVYSRSVVLRFKQDIPDFAAGTYLYVDLDHIINPTEARQYAVTVRLDNRHGQTIAGPSLSDWFEVTPGPASKLTIFPTNDTTLQAGQGIAFSAFITDDYGNQIEGAQAQWMLDPTGDSIGTLFGSFFQATTVGTGRIIAHADTLEAVSGTITVTPGDAAAMVVTGNAEPVRIGQPLPYDISLEIQDRFGNRKGDYLGSVWFTSDDSLAEIVHDEANPYQFTATDAGRAVFPGDQFVFKTAGARVLTATDGNLSGSAYVLVESGVGPADFDVAMPVSAVAGSGFTISITNAVDSAGDPYNGVILILGGNVAPDGTEPIVPAIEIINGQGSAQVTLYAAGRNSLIFHSGTSSLQKYIDIRPGSLAALDLAIGRTQFLGNPFRGQPHIQAYDEFRNPKTDFRDLDIDIQLSSENGTLTPDIVHPDQFDQTGAADLSSYQYDGRPGLVTITAATVDYTPTVQTSADIIANGVYAEINEHTELPDWMPSGWIFDFQGEAWNPAELTPKQIEYSAGFIGGDSPSPSIYPTIDCLPQAGMVHSCYFTVHQEAGETSGTYEYQFRISAIYDVQGEEVTAVWTYSGEVTIVPFVPFAIRADSLPDVALSGNYSIPIALSLIDGNDYDIDAKAAINVFVRKDTTQFWLSHTSFTFSWNSETTINVDAHFSSQIPNGQYDYAADLVASIFGPDQTYRINYQKSYSLDKTVDIVARAHLAVDTLSIMPTRVPVGASIAFAYDLNLTGTTDIVLYGEQSTLTVTDGIVSATVFLRDSLYTLTPGANALTADNMIIPGSWEGKHLTALFHAVGLESGVAPVNQTLEFSFPVTVEASAAAVQALSLINSAPNSPFVNIGQQFIMNAAVVNLSDNDLTGPFIITLRSDGQSVVPPPVTVPEIPARDTLKIAFSVTAAAETNPAEVFSFQISPPQSVDVLPAADDNAVGVIQTPAQLELTAGIPGKAPLTAVMAYGEGFNVVASAVNHGQAAISGGRLDLKYAGPGDFGISFPNELPLDSQVTWSLTAPADDINSAFVVAWKEIPIDRNTGDAAILTTDSVALPFTVRAPETRLSIQAGGFTTRPLMRGQTSKLFDLGLENITNDSRNSIALNTIIMEFTDRQGHAIFPWEVMTDSSTNFFVDGKPVARAEYPVTAPEQPQVNVMFVFDSILIQPGGTLNMEFLLTPPVTTNRDFFNIRITGAMIAGQIAGGPQVGDTVPVTGALDRSFEVNIPQSIMPQEFAASFKNYPNPFNPNTEQTEIRYNLPKESDVDIYIYTVTGELVRHLHFAAGSVGGQAGLNAGIYWDGANGEGRTVLNGIYVAYIEVPASDLTATLKMAVVK